MYLYHIAILLDDKTDEDYAELNIELQKIDVRVASYDISIKQKGIYLDPQFYECFDNSKTTIELRNSIHEIVRKICNNPEILVTPYDENEGKSEYISKSGDLPKHIEFKEYLLRYNEEIFMQ